MVEFIAGRWADIAFRSYQHVSLVVQAMILATVVAVGLAVLLVGRPRLEALANGISAVGLTIPSFALLGLLLPLVGIGTMPSVIAVAFYGVLPILRNAIVGLASVDKHLLESARGMGMNPLVTFWKIRLPLAWPVIMAGLRVSTQMSMGVAAIAAYALGPGLGTYIFTGLAQIGGKNALSYALVGTVGVIVLAILMDWVLLLIGRLTTSKGIRA